MMILPTQNKSWGFWGTATALLNDETKVKEAWAVAFSIVQKIADFTPQETLGLMDSRWGRHTVDELVDAIDNIKSLKKELKAKMTKERLHRDFNYYVDSNWQEGQNA